MQDELDCSHMALTIEHVSFLFTLETEMAAKQSFLVIPTLNTFRVKENRMQTTRSGIQLHLRSGSRQRDCDSQGHMVSSLTARFFVGAVRAVLVVVAHPGERHALPRHGAASELLGAAHLHLCNTHNILRTFCAIPLVRQVRAVGLVVANPGVRDADSGEALELSGSARTLL
jgi:hypothetical protein